MWYEGRKVNCIFTTKPRYSAVYDYDFNENKITSMYGLMFVIMMWDETTRIGCAISRNLENNEGFVTVMYAPGVFTRSPAEYKKHIHLPHGLLSKGHGMYWTSLYIKCVRNKTERFE